MFRQIQRFASKSVEESRKALKSARLKELRERKLKSGINAEDVTKTNRKGEASNRFFQVFQKLFLTFSTKLTYKFQKALIGKALTVVFFIIGFIAAENVWQDERYRQIRNELEIHGHLKPLSQ